MNNFGEGVLYSAIPKLNMIRPGRDIKSEVLVFFTLLHTLTIVDHLTATLQLVFQHHQCFIE